jgi:uncharacterized membrane protein YphA (DoxX/SURF4 family)
MNMKPSPDILDIAFRGLFCLIFVGLGAEHMVNDELIQKLMPTWVPAARTVSFVCGMWLFIWGMFILLGWHLRVAALALMAFLIPVTLAVHVPGVVSYPVEMEESYRWMWAILQRTNLVKNLCLIGVCLHLLNHVPGRYSLAHRRRV